jgi:RimJ/RimL family protein N-acetyltransferase
MVNKFLSEYPKKFKTKDNIEITVRQMIKEDEARLLEFFKKLSETDRMYLRDDVSKPETIRKWVENLNYERVFPVLAFHGDSIIGDATLHRKEFGWKKNIGEIRIVVSPDFRKKGVGAILAREIYYIALKTGLKKLMAEMMAEQHNAIKVFDKLGFVQEAVLSEHVVDAKGKMHNLVIMTNDVEALWEKIKDYEKYNLPDYSTEC